MSADRPLFRTGAVARMLRMPPATLRVWERRYAVCAPARSPSGQCLYSAADVRRLALIRQLLEQGHAIGQLAAQPMAQLKAMAGTHAQAATRSGRRAAPAAPRWDLETLRTLAGLSSTIACECPQHLATLLLQLQEFEAYSASCAQQSPDDAALHRRLQLVSGQARRLLEDALAEVVRAEGLLGTAG